ncbi:MAG: hypothetical protein QOJ98_1688 [Acidobacteriota bacterium]|jgi:hypothetical protein|nr:hypothetical protein [Acidobacteriota bacterium]
MKRLFAIALFAGAAFAQSPVEQVVNDAMVVDRVAEASKRDLPADLLERIVDEDIELLRGRRADGSYEYATYERFEAGRITKEFSVQPNAEKMETNEVRGANIYRVIVEVPSRRMLVRRNRPVWVERVDVELIAQGASQLQQQSFEVKAWLQPGEIRPIDLPAVSRQVTAKVIATAEKDGGYGNLEVALVQARIVDLATSPYAEAVASAKALQRALNNNELTSVRASAQRMRDALGGSGTIAVVAPRLAPAASASEMPDAGTQLELQTELQLIEDLLTGNESERREGLDKLHQLIRRMR